MGSVGKMSGHRHGDEPKLPKPSNMESGVGFLDQPT